MTNLSNLDKYHDLLTVKEVAEILRVSENVVYSMIKKDQLKFFRFGRDYKIPKAWLIDTFILSNTPKQPEA